jgi:hemolysin activation/secretion protein
MAVSLASAFAILAAPAVAQPAQQQPVSPVTVAPESLAPEQKRTAVKVDIPATSVLKAPEGSENLAITLGSVEVSGAFDEVAGSVETALSQLRGREVTLAQIYAAASEIEAAHARAGFVLARVSIPPQELVDGGALKLAVTDGYIEAVDVSAVAERVREPVARRADALVNTPKLTLRDIEEALGMAAEVPGLRFRSTLVRGSQPGAVKLVLEGEQQLVTGFVGVDNQLDSSLGRWGTNLQLVLNSPFGAGEQFYGFASSDYSFRDYFSNTARQRVLGGGAIVPVGDGRFSLNPEVTFATTTPDTPMGVLRTRGLLRRLTLRGQAVIDKSRSRDLRLGLAVEQIDVRNEALDFAIRLNRDQYMAARLTGTLANTSPSGARTGLTIQFSNGLGGFGGIDRAESVRTGTPFSRVGASPNFTRLLVSGRSTIPLGEAQLALFGSAQTTFGDPVFRSEQFNLEGPEALSAFVGGRGAVDAGLVGRAEISGVSDASGESGPSLTLSLYVFTAFGAGRLEAPTAVERRSIDAFNFGAGLRGTVANRIDFAVEYARSESRIPFLDNADRVSVTTTLRF